MSKALAKTLSQIDHQVLEHAKNLERLLERLKKSAIELQKRGHSPRELEETKNMVENVQRQLDRIKYGG
jgi:rubrerythrin